LNEEKQGTSEFATHVPINRHVGNTIKTNTKVVMDKCTHNRTSIKHTIA